MTVYPRLSPSIARLRMWKVGTFLRPLSPALLAIGYLCVSGLWILGTVILFELSRALEVVHPSEGVLFVSVGAVPYVVATAVFVYFTLRQLEMTNATEAAQLRLVGDTVSSGIALVDHRGVFQITNPTFRRLFDFSPAIEGVSSVEYLMGRYLTDSHESILPTEGELRVSFRIPQNNGSGRDVNVLSRVFETERGQLGWILKAEETDSAERDKNDRIKASRALEIVPDGISIAQLDHPDIVLTYVNRAFCELTGYDEAELIGRNCRFLQGADRQQPEIKILREALLHGRPAAVTLRNYRKDGTMFWADVRLAPVLDDSGMATHYISLLRDVTESRANTTALDRLSNYDPGTSLPNRSHFRTMLEGLLAEPAPRIAVSRLEVSDFADIVACFGEEAAHLTVVQVAERVRAALPGCMLASFGRGELGIAVRLNEAMTVDHATALLKEASAAEFRVAAVSIRIRACIGTTLGLVGQAADTLLQQTLVALIHSKRQGLGSHSHFDTRSETDLRRRVKLSSDLHQAVLDRDFELHYQPKINLQTGAITGAEALLRWKHPIFGLQPPSCFIPQAEQSDHISTIGSWVLREVAEFSAAVNHNRWPPLTFSINLSAVQFQRDDFVGLLIDDLQTMGVDPSWITLEITEAVFTGGFEQAAVKLRALVDAGYRISIDDFGTGYSNLQFLSEFPLSEIKIDPSFVRGVESSVYKRTVVASVVKIGASLDVDVVAKGIETKSEWESMASLGVSQGFGHYFSYPLVSAEFTALLDTQSRLRFNDIRAAGEGVSCRRSREHLV